MYKQIERIRAFDVQSMVGNAGGYIGLFLGYALIQLPDALASIFRWCQEKMKK